MDRANLMGNLMLLIIGGNDTTRNSMSGSVLALNENPGEYAMLRANHKLVETMVPEVIRGRRRWHICAVRQPRTRNSAARRSARASAW